MQAQIKKIKGIERGLIAIGNKIDLWRHDIDMKKVIDLDSFKTRADVEAHNCLVNLIRSYFSETIVLSEEDHIFPTQRPEKYWLIDPIDGTGSWFNGFDGFVTQIAYIENDIPVYGAIYSPRLSKLWTAYRDMGAYLNNEPLLPLAKRDRLNLIDNYPTPRRISKKISDLMEITRYIECGSLGLKLCMVADGTADLFVKDVIIRDWDIAPSSVLIKELGGIIWDLNGRKINFTGSVEKKDGLLVARDLSLASAVLSKLQGD